MTWDFLGFRALFVVEIESFYTRNGARLRTRLWQWSPGGSVILGAGPETPGSFSCKSLLATQRPLSRVSRQRYLTLYWQKFQEPDKRHTQSSNRLHLMSQTPPSDFGLRVRPILQSAGLDSIITNEYIRWYYGHATARLSRGVLKIRRHIKHMSALS